MRHGFNGRGLAGGNLESRCDQENTEAGDHPHYHVLRKVMQNVAELEET